MRKRTSKRRWKTKALRGQLVPLTAIVEHRLDRWRLFESASFNSDMYFLPDVLSQVSLESALVKARAAFACGVAVLSIGSHGIRTISADEYYL